MAGVIRLVAASVDLLDAAIMGDDAVARALGYNVTPGWVTFRRRPGARGLGGAAVRRRRARRRHHQRPRGADSPSARRWALRRRPRAAGLPRRLHRRGHLAGRPVIGGDGILPADAGGQVHCEEIGEWRPDAEVVGWVAGCSCGWRRTPWTRVPPELADPAARRLATAGPWADLEAADENRVRQEWHQHIAGWQALEDVEAAAARQAAAARALDEAVRAALAAGAPWADIGRAAGLTGPSATERRSARD